MDQLKVLESQAVREIQMTFQIQKNIQMTLQNIQMFPIVMDLLVPWQQKRARAWAAA